MYKILGLLSILSASIATGFVMANELKERLKLLTEIHLSLMGIRSEFEYRAPVLEECFKNRGVLFSNAYCYIEKDNLLPQDALKKACNDLKPLNRDDKKVLYRFAENLNTEDINGQISNISWLIDNLEDRIHHAENEYRTKGRLYRSSGALTGLGFLILFVK